ncbi:MAG: LacI family DNA-binding transcriptional regulator [Eubacteriales bacterium]|nr:LacI family DNA-binding transcriptional regulator [Eubacteriales bacterium]
MVSLKMIAEYCGVSTATVSKALHDRSDIGAETKQRVRDAAKKLGYLPNSAARTLKNNRTDNIGVLYNASAGGLTHEYFSGVLNSFREEAENHGYDITFIENGVHNHEMTFLEHCRFRNFDGVVIVCADYEDAQVQELMNSDLTVVTIDYVHQNCPSISSNNIRGMEELVRYIISMGHTKIAYIHGEEFSYVTRERLTMFYRVMDEYGLDLPDEYIIPARYLSTKDAADATRYLLELEEPPTCIIYPDDTAFIGGRNVITERGLMIPDDISVAGYDGVKMSQILHPKLTTIHQNTEAIGKEAAKKLIACIEKPKMTLIDRVVIDGDLLHGQSVKRLESK